MEITEITCLRVSGGLLFRVRYVRGGVAIENVEIEALWAKRRPRFSHQPILSIFILAYQLLMSGE